MDHYGRDTSPCARAVKSCYIAFFATKNVNGKDLPLKMTLKMRPTNPHKQPAVRQYEAIQ